ncbi:hypothetical protein HK102_009461 [Quaeritorhiza haematococci]|nr:hypothetical protein HK102_009461 [Quaeritorhiza haematococci]
MPAGILKVTVVEAKNLKDEETLGRNDPYVELSVDKKHVQKTSVKQNTNTPVWNETLTLAINEGDNALNVKVLDKDTLDSDKIGEATVPLGDVFTKGNVDTWVKLPKLMGLMSNGEVHLKLHFTRA